MRWILTCATILVAFYLELTYAPLTWPQLVGLKTEAAFDLWTPEHAAGGYIIGRCLGHFRRYDPFTYWLWLVLSLTYSWEISECLMEVHGTAHMRLWLAGTEHWSNRLVTDPLVFTVCAFYGRHTPGRQWMWFAVLYLGWYTFNLLEPTCMTVQSAIFRT